MVDVANCPLCEVSHYCAGLNRTKASVHCRSGGVSAVEGVWSIEILSGRSELCVTSQVSIIEGYPLSGIPLYNFMHIEYT